MSLPPHQLPPAFLLSVDPVEQNPFSSDDPRHQIWSDATNEAEEALHRFNSLLLLQGGEVAALGPIGLNAFTQDNAAGKFDIWANRYLAVVRTRNGIPDFDRWLASYAQAWLDDVRTNALRREAESGVDQRVDDLLVGLRTRLLHRLEHWRAEARKWVSEWEVYVAKVREAASQPTVLKPPPTVNPAIVKRRRAVVAQYRKDRDLTAALHARCLGMSTTAILGIIKEDWTRFSGATQNKFLTAMGLTHEDWYHD